MPGNFTAFSVFTVVLLISSNHMEATEYDGGMSGSHKVGFTLLFHHVETNRSSVTVAVYTQAFYSDSPK